MRERTRILFLTVAMVTVSAVLIAFPASPARSRNAAPQKSTAAAIDCWFNVKSGAVILDSAASDVINHLTLTCREPISRINKVKLNDQIITNSREAELWVYEDKKQLETILRARIPGQIMDRRVLMPGQPLNSLNAGSYKVEAEVSMMLGGTGLIGTEFVIAPAVATGTQSTQPAGPPNPGGTVDTPEQGEPINPLTPPTGPLCSYPITGVVLHFHTPQAGIPEFSYTASEKRRFFLEKMKPQVSSLLTDLVRQTVDSEVQSSGIQLPGSANYWSLVPPPNGAPGWNGAGVALLNGLQAGSHGNYFGVGAPRIGSGAHFLNFQHYINDVIKPTIGEGELPIILVDAILTPEGTRTSVPGYFLRASRVIVASASRYALLGVSEFLATPPSVSDVWGVGGSDQHDQLNNLYFGHVLAHELGHSFALGHAGETSNLMYPHIASVQQVLNPPILVYSQGCLVRYRCLNQIAAFAAPLHTDTGCGDGELQSVELDGLSETCEIGYENYEAPFRLNCDLDNPTPNGAPFNFSSHPDGTLEYWGNLNTPLWCFSEIPKGSSFYIEPGSSAVGNNQNLCRVATFCGDSLIESNKGEECDSASKEENHGCTDQSKECGGMIENESGVTVKFNCRCIPRCDEGKEWIPACEICCPTEMTCVSAATGCQCPEATPNFNPASGECEAEDPSH